MKRIIYSVGSTGARALVQLKNLMSETERKDSVFGAFDMDILTGNVGLPEEELCLVQENDFRGELQRIISARNVQPSLFERVNDIVPLSDRSYVNTRPATHGAGACKDPSVSSVAGFLNRRKLQEVVEKATNLVGHHTRKGERYAYLLLSPCGGTSTGLHLAVLEKLLAKNFTVFLFFLSPSYFMRVQSDTEGQLKANTLATLLRTAYDKAAGHINYLEDKPQTGTVYPFILESDWENSQFAEFSIKDRSPSQERFCKYVAMTLLAFIHNHTKQTPGSDNIQPWLSSYINDEIPVAENEEFFNAILLYPRLGNLKTSTEVLKKKMQEKNNKSARENLLWLLKDQNISDAASAIVNRPKLVEDAIKEAIRTGSLPAGSIREILGFVQQSISRTQN